MILAYHLVWTAYGWWFPNDPRGSWSEEIWNSCLAGLPARRKIRLGREPVQPTPVELRHWLKVAQKRLKYPPVVLDDAARKVTHEAIMTQVRLHRYVIVALAVMQEHVHIVVERHEHDYERIVQGFKAVTSRELRKHFGLAAGFSRRDDCALKHAAKRKPIPIWSRGYWVRYLDNQKAITQAIAYVRRQK